MGPVYSGPTIFMPGGALAEADLRVGFFDLIFGEQEGYLCIAAALPEIKSSFVQRFYKWPDEYPKAEQFIFNSEGSRNVWFCVNLLSKQDRKKQYALPSNLVWADLDLAPIEEIKPTPSIIIRTSSQKTQVLWRLSTHVEPLIAENFSKRIAYAYKQNGADPSGWDLTQLLRVPFTINHKYKNKPVVVLERALETKAEPLLFELLPDVPDSIFEGLEDVPELLSVEKVIYKYAGFLKNTQFAALYSMELAEKDDWSKYLWKLIHVCFEAGMDKQEVLSVVSTSNINKYDRDNRPITHLWRDVVKANESQESLNVITANFRPLTMPGLVVEPSQKHDSSFIVRYNKWASLATDAVNQFHDLSAFVLLSSLVSSSIRLPTSYGDITPNLWGLILGDSTLTRKTTAMKMAMEIIGLIDKEMVVATDGSVEGLLTGLEQRPNRTSIFFKDEVSGFFDSINKKDWLAGMPETLTALYDVPPFFTRRLRKETISIESPVFIFFGGGVKDKVFENLKDDYVISGFLPRFLVVSGDADMSLLRRTGPATHQHLNARSSIVANCADIFEVYNREVKQTIAGQEIYMPLRIEAELTPKAWESYGEFEGKLLEAAANSSLPSLALPTFERLSRSLLKMSVVLASSDKPPQTNILKVEEDYVIEAAWYVQQWGKHSIELITSAGLKHTEKIVERVFRTIDNNPGILRSDIMTHHHLMKREADEVLNTLEERQLIKRAPHGRGTRYWAV